jgi:hypothetical protein
LEELKYKNKNITISKTNTTADITISLILIEITSTADEQYESLDRCINVYAPLLRQSNNHFTQSIQQQSQNFFQLFRHPYSSAFSGVNTSYINLINPRKAIKKLPKQTLPI